MTTPTTPPPTDLHGYIEPLKREVAVPGEFDTTFANTSDDDILGLLEDAFAEAQLDGFFGNQTLDLTTGVVTPGLSSGGGALVVLYGGVRMIRSQLRNLKNQQKYEAGGATYEVSTSATILTQELKDLTARKNNLLALVLRQARGQNAVYVSDGYLTKSRGYFPTGYYGEFGSFYGYEIAGFAMLIDF